MKLIFYGNSLTKGKAGVSYLKKISSNLNNHKIVNYGKDGDTVFSLYERILKDKLTEEADICFLWIGTNDVFVKVSKLYSILKFISRQKPAENHEEFSYYYKEILYILSENSHKVVCISPTFVGENLDNKWNLELKELSKIINSLTKNFENVKYFDLRSIFYKKLKSENPSDFIIKRIRHLIFDYLFCRSTEKINLRSKKRDLIFTLDGVHLNEKGAEIVADALVDYIKENEVK